MAKPKGTLSSCLFLQKGKIEMGQKIIWKEKHTRPKFGEDKR